MPVTIAGYSFLQFIKISFLRDVVYILRNIFGTI